MTLRLSGLASGLDTESVIEALIEVKQQPIDTLNDELDTNSEIYDIWEEIDLATSTLSAAVTDLCSYSTWNAKNITFSDEDVVDGTVSGSLANDGDYYLIVTDLAVAHSYHTDTSAVSDTDSQLNLSGTFTINGVEITVNTTDSLEDIRDSINSETSNMDGVGATASIIGTALVLTSGETGVGNEMTITDTDGILTGLGLFNNETAAQDMAGTIDGISVSSTTNDSVSDFITGVTLNFNETGTSTIRVNRDTESIIETIDTFITAYNDLMDYLSVQTEYVDSEEAGSTDNEEGDSGLLNGDSLANQIQRKCRAILTQVTNENETVTSLYSCGIWTESEDNNFAIVDEDALEDALNSNFEEVQSLFRSYGSADPTDEDEDGLFRQLDSYLTYLLDGTGGGISTKMDTIADKDARLEDRIERMQADLETYELELWQHYAIMEEAVSTIQTSADYVLSAIGESRSDD